MTSPQASHPPVEVISLTHAIQMLEAQRAVLGDEVVNAALTPLLERLKLLEGNIELSSRGGERKIVTVIFADLTGFTSLAASRDAEMVRDLVISVFDRLAPLVKKYGGTIEKFIGDEILAIFGAPVTHENDPERALRCALDMMSELAQYNLDNQSDFSLHMGVNTGLVVAGSIGSRTEAGYGVVGDMVNTASRLEDASPKGQIYVGWDTYHATESIFMFERLPDIVVKGKPEPLPVFRLLGIKPKLTPGLRWVEAAGKQYPLVGREHELTLFRNKIARLKTGQGGILFITGEAGMGKSRLVAELSKETGQDQRYWLEGRALSISQSFRYWPFQEIIRQYVGINDEDNEGTAWDKLENQIVSLFPDQADEILPYLASLLNLPIKEVLNERVRYLDGEAMRRQLFLAVFRFFERLAGTYPVVLVFEDIHWMDQSSTALFEHIASLVSNLPLLICGVSRNDPASPLARLMEVAYKNLSRDLDVIILAPLTISESDQLVGHLLDEKILPTELHKLIQKKAEGNPFFIEEVVRSLIDYQAIAQDTTGWHWIADPVSISIPDTIQGVILARIDRLGEEVKEVLRIASVIGRTFLYRLIRAVDEADQELDHSLQELKTLELIREKSHIPELAYLFQHALTQEATYQSILIRQRKDIHARVGKCLEQLFAGHLEGVYSLLAYHFARAEDWTKAQDYLFKAGDQASNLAADAEALECYQQAMGAYLRSFGDTWDPIKRAMLERKMAEALFHRGEIEKANECFMRALNCLGISLPTTRRALLLSTIREFSRQITHRLLPGFFIKPFVIPSPTMEEERQILERMGSIDALVNVERFIWVVLQLLNDSESRGYMYGVAIGLAALGTIFDMIPMPKIAEKYHQRALQLAEQSQHPNAIGRTYNLMGIHEILLTRLDSAASYGLKAADLYRKTGSVWDWYLALSQSAIPALGFQGKVGQAITLCQELIQMGQEIGDLQAQEMGTGLQASAFRYLGDLDRAIELGKKAIELDQVTNDPYLGSIFYAELGRSYIAQQQFELAMPMLEKGLSILTSHSLRGASAGRVYNGLAEAYLWAAENRPDERLHWLKLSSQACRQAQKQGKFVHESEAEGYRYRGTYEWLKGNHATAKKYWGLSTTIAQKTGQMINLRLVYLEMGKRLGQTYFLEQAENLKSKIINNSSEFGVKFRTT